MAAGLRLGENLETVLISVMTGRQAMFATYRGEMTGQETVCGEIEDEDLGARPSWTMSFNV